jgi:hypothetical protein
MLHTTCVATMLGLSERIRVKSLHDGRDFLYGLVKIYAMRG